MFDSQFDNAFGTDFANVFGLLNSAWLWFSIIAMIISVIFSARIPQQF
jgi:hypothetical protein